MRRHQHYLHYADLEGLLDLPQTEEILTVHVDPATRSIFLECTGGDEITDGKESPIFMPGRHR